MVWYLEMEFGRQATQTYLEPIMCLLAWRRLVLLASSYCREGVYSAQASIFHVDIYAFLYSQP
jgi:hypothetical protein